MSKFRKKPVVIDAVQWDGKLTTAEAFGVTEFSQELTSDTLQIHTLEGEMTANLGDWIIKGVKGEFYPCKPDIFAATYEAGVRMSDGGPAFPNVPDGAGDRWNDWDQGMTLRDYFAAKAVQGGVAFNWRDNDYRPIDGMSIIDNSARHAYLIADAMIRAREAS